MRWASTADPAATSIRPRSRYCSLQRPVIGDRSSRLEQRVGALGPARGAAFGGEQPSRTHGVAGAEMGGPMPRLPVGVGTGACKYVGEGGVGGR